MYSTESTASRDEPLQTALSVLTTGLASLDEVADAVVARRAVHPPIGRLLLSHGKLTMQHVFEILKEQAVISKPFGEIAVDMGLVTESDVSEMLRLQRSLSPTLLDVLISRNVMSAEQAERIYQELHNKSSQSTEHGTDVFGGHHRD